jgi:protein-tyrosine phosphatase
MLQEWKGCLALMLDQPEDQVVLEVLNKLRAMVPEQAQQNQKTRDGDSLHLTIVGPQEWKGISAANKTEHQKCTAISILGLGRNQDVYFAVCSYPAGDELRHKLGLDPKEFHITLGFMRADSQEIAKNESSIVHWSGAKTLQAAAANLSVHVLSKNVRTLEAILRHLEGKAKGAAESLAECEDEAVHVVRCKLLRSYMNAKQYDQGEAMAASLLDTDRADAIVEALYVRSRTRIHLGHARRTVAEDARADMWLRRTALSGPRPAVPFDDRARYLEQLLLDAGAENDRLWILEEIPSSSPTAPGGGGDDGAKWAQFTAEDLPFHFGYILPGLAGSGAPSARTVRVAVAAGVAAVVSLTEDPLTAEVRAAADAARRRAGAPPAHFLHLPIPDLHAPKDGAELLRIVRAVDDAARAAAAAAAAGGWGGHTLVHCKGGKGRTVMVLAGVLMLRGVCPTPGEALGRLRASRTVSTTAEQNGALKELYGLLCQEAMAAGPAAAGNAAGAAGAGALPAPLGR